MEVTQEILHNELQALGRCIEQRLEQCFDQKFAETKNSIVTWVVGLFIGTSVLITALGSIFINIVFQ